MSDFNVIELMTAIVGSVAAGAAVTSAVIQLKAVKLELETKQKDQAVQEPSNHPKQSADGKPPQ
ncbi:hypothetical protein [Glycomyces algeriensis]|uniref:Uncharacterized protein n=2 Tax=Glycomyces algeriensis TaxID=256037 RepID=A0A9W6GCS8_9ACTN|nr:hypothetical protein [Glycomyces algeriensis]MDA1366784.1 hypothetical protein [Glycomyces algeriensis]MDA1368635.1 hypothetical protein [Glycomyces algeriensis]MDR7351671.1 hypothetical protein [Glycomyces algeriensis]GLI44394.1 hypothetical protein GALLR39Z86_42440 [Glycomyces algeriensis]